MKQLLKAISDFQKECPVIHKGTKGYGYTYADLPAILEVINPILKKHKIGFIQAVDGDKLETCIFHEDGESITRSANIPQGVKLKGMNDFQILGSAITYMRRYQLSAMLGIVTDKDVDAPGEQEPKTEPKTEPKKTKQESKPPITQERFEKALNAIQTGETNKDVLLNHFTLTDEQKTKLDKL